MSTPRTDDPDTWTVEDWERRLEAACRRHAEVGLPLEPYRLSTLVNLDAITISEDGRIRRLRGGGTLSKPSVPLPGYRVVKGGYLKEAPRG